MSRPKERRRIAAWLGLVAFAIQVLIPLLVAGEISLADTGAYAGVFRLDICERGAAPRGAGGVPAQTDPHQQHHALCPICLALVASPAFTQPAALPMPMPRAKAVAVALPETRPAPRPASLLVYRSRAPPLG
jgi:Protein of unknown function (DUF2946)